MPLEMWRDSIPSWRGRPESRTGTLLQHGAFKLWVTAAVVCAGRMNLLFVTAAVN